MLMDVSFSITIVYGPCDHGSKQCFLDSVHGPWIIIGDFNLIRFPNEKSSDKANFNGSVMKVSWVLNLLTRKMREKGEYHEI